MTIETIKSFYDAKPFVPFVIQLADGREIPVHSREYIMAAPTGRTLIVYQSDDTFNWIDLLLVTNIRAKASPNGHGARRKR